ncbi:MAG TPA: ATP-binding protein [Woeseiaceae bacterium]|nr:ATP-binding protein [Woeseiaceae bacterium]
MKQQLRTRFRWLTALQVLLLVASIAFLVASLFLTRFIAVPIVLAAVVVMQTLVLLHSVYAHVKALEEFFTAVQHEDFTRRFVADDLDAELKVAFNKVIERFRNTRADRDLYANYLDTVIHHVPVPFMAVQADGSVTLANKSLYRLTGLNRMSDIRDLEKLDATLPARLTAVRAGEKQLLQTMIRGIPVELRVSVAEMRIAGKVERLYSIENLSGELSARESTAWRNLIRVLTHEIMNTLTPVTSLAHTTKDLLEQSTELGPEADDIREAVSTIGRRSESLIDFVSRYRELLQVPIAKCNDIPVHELFVDVIALLQSPLDKIDVTINVRPASLEVFADRQLIDQVLINLVTNAIDVLHDRPDARIELSAQLDYGRVVISVTDNGPGIPVADLEQVFIPFFTTRRGGSGIGLTVCRQVMLAHDGEIALDSSTSGTTARLVFR